MWGRESPSAALPRSEIDSVSSTVSPPFCTGPNATFWPNATIFRFGLASYSWSTCWRWAAVEPKDSATQSSGVTRRTGRLSWSSASSVNPKNCPPTRGQKKRSWSFPGSSSVGVTSGRMPTWMNGKSCVSEYVRTGSPITRNFRWYSPA